MKILISLILLQSSIKQVKIL